MTSPREKRTATNAFASRASTCADGSEPDTFSAVRAANSNGECLSNTDAGMLSRSRSPARSGCAMEGV